MDQHNRRTFLKVSGALVGGMAVGGTVTAATAIDRFIVDTKGLESGKLAHSDLNVVHDLDEVDLAVVEGEEGDVEALGVDYGSDTTYDIDLPTDRAPVSASESATDEPYYGIQWDKQAQDIPAVHEHTRGEGTRVAIIDTGVGAGHPDLQQAVNADLSKDFTGDGHGAPGPWGGYHGTHVAGIVASNDRNETGVAGSAPGAEIVDCRVFSPGALASFADIVAAMTYSAAVECDVANLSIGAYPVERKALGSFYGKVLNRVTTYANSQGTLLVVAAGNDAADLQHDGGGVSYYDVDGDGDEDRVVHSAFISLPNEAAAVMSISATGPIGFNWGDEGLAEPFYQPAKYTNYGTNAINVSAPGGNYHPDFPAGWYYDLVFNAFAQVTTETKGNGKKGEGKGGKTETSVDYGYAWLAGTSMAAPQVAAAAALVRSVDPSLNANQVRKTLENTAQDVGKRQFHGHGFLNPLAAVESLL